jgi:hypothetical protein
MTIGKERSSDIEKKRKRGREREKERERERERERECSCTSWFSPFFYYILFPGLWDSAAHFQGRTSTPS